jgi:hypothetical protein
MNTAENKKLLKKYLDKLTKNKVVYINGKVIRASDLNYTICQNAYDEESDLGDVKITVTPYSYTMKIVPSMMMVKIYENGKVTLNDYVSAIGDGNKPSDFISRLTDCQIEKLIVALEPIVSAVDKEVALINEESNTSELRARKNIIKKLKKNLKSGINFDKLTVSELNKLYDLVEKALV